MIFVVFDFNLFSCKLKTKKTKIKYLTDDCPDEFYEICKNECKGKNMEVCFCKNYDYFNQFLQKCVCLKNKEDCEKYLNLFYKNKNKV